MTAVTPIVLPPLELHDRDLAPAALGEHLARYLGALEMIGTDDDLAVAGHHEHRGEGHRSASVPVQLLELDDLARGHQVLLATRCDDGFHGSSGLPAHKLSDGRSSDHTRQPGSIYVGGPE